MSHVRTQARAAIAAALAPIGHPVHTSRVYPVQLDDLPVLLVYSGAEAIDGQMDALERAYEVHVEAIVSGDNYESTLDALLVQIEEALTGSLSNLVLSAMPTEIETSAGAEGSTPIGRLRATFRVHYRTTYTDPETSI